MQLLMHAAHMAAMAGCTPKYLDVEGEIDRTPPEAQIEMARSGTLGHGTEGFLGHLEKWRAEGGIRDIEVRI